MENNNIESISGFSRSTLKAFTTSPLFELYVLVFYLILNTFNLLNWLYV